MKNDFVQHDTNTDRLDLITSDRNETVKGIIVAESKKKKRIKNKHTNIISFRPKEKEKKKLDLT